jgi:hypothetical protein
VKRRGEAGNKPIASRLGLRKVLWIYGLVADIDRRPMMSEILALLDRKRLGTPRPLRFAEAQSRHRNLAEPEPSQIFVVETRRYLNFTVVVKCYEAAIKQKISIWRQ